MHNTRKTKRLLLRPIVKDDLKHFISLYTSAEVMKYFGQCTPYEETSIAETFHQRLERTSSSSFGWFVVETLDSSTFIGLCGSGFPESNGKVEIAFLFDAEYWGKGYGTESIREFVSYLFEQSSVQTVFATARPENLSSIRIMQKLGLTFQKEETRFHHRRFFYSITREEYSNNNKH